MYALAQAWSDLGKCNTNCSLTAAALLYSAGERLTATHFNLLHSLLDETLVSMRTSLRRKASGPLDRLAAPAGAAMPFVEAWVSHARGVYDICAETQDELAGLSAGLASEANQLVETALGELELSAPPATALALGYARSALNTANLAFDGALASSRQLAAMTDAQMSTASLVVLRAGSAGLPAR